MYVKEAYIYFSFFILPDSEKKQVGWLYFFLQVCVCVKEKILYIFCSPFFCKSIGKVEEKLFSSYKHRLIFLEMKKSSPVTSERPARPSAVIISFHNPHSHLYPHIILGYRKRRWAGLMRDRGAQFSFIVSGISVYHSIRDVYRIFYAFLY